MPEQAGRDSWGCLWEFSPVTGSYPGHEHRIKSVDEIVDFAVPDPFAPGLLDAAKRAIEKIDRSQTVVVCNNHIGLHERSYILLGMEEYLVEFALNEKLIVQLLDKIKWFKLNFAKRMLDELDIDGIWFGDDWGTQNNLFISPEKWREFFKPKYKELYDLVHDRGKLVFQHSCGKIESIIPDLVEIGLDVWNPCQPINDLEGLKKAYGKKLAFMGSVDSVVLDTKGRKEIEEEIRLRISQLKEGGGFVLYPSHHVAFPEENVKAFTEFSVKYGKY
jgi:uroporphyrinogen decarboxylase